MDGRSSRAIRGDLGLGPNDIYAGGGNGQMVHFDGTKWTEQDTNPTGGEHITQVWGSGPTDVYATTNANVILHSVGDGIWTRHVFPAGWGFDDVWGTSATNVYAIASSGLIHLDASGQWSSRQTAGGSYGIQDLWGIAADDLWGVSYYGQVWHSAPGLRRVQDLRTELGVRELHDIWASGPNDIYVVGRDCILHSRGDGVWVNELPADAPRDLMIGVWGFGPNAVYVLTQSGGLVYRSGGDGRWFSQMIAPSGASSSYPGIWGTSPENMYVHRNFRIYHGKLP